MSDPTTEGWTPEELAELAAAEAAERGETAPAADNAGVDPENQGNPIEGDETSGEGEAKSERAMPTYGVLETADAFPTQEPPKRGGGGPSKKLHKQLQVLVDKPELHGKAVKVIEFTTSNGAKNAIEDVVEGRRSIPDGVWVLKALRTNDAQGKRVSHLWAVFQGAEVTEAAQGKAVTATLNVADATEKPKSQTEANGVQDDDDEDGSESSTAE